MKDFKKFLQRVKKGTKRRFGYFKNHVEFKVKGSTIKFPTKQDVSKNWFYPRYLFGGIHEPETANLLLSVLEQGDIFFDVGAHLGFFGLLTGITDTSEVHMFEIDGLLSQPIKEAVQMSFPKQQEKFSIVTAAVSEKSGKTVAYKPNKGTNTSTNTVHKTNSESIRKTTSLSLDDYCSENNSPDVIKIDVEGAEKRVIEGMKKSIKAERPIIILEIHPHILDSVNVSSSGLVQKIKKMGKYRVSLIGSQNSEHDLSKFDQEKIGNEATTLVFH